MPRVFALCCEKGLAFGIAAPRLKNLSRPRQLYQALADEARLKVLSLLSRGEHCVSEIVKELGLPQPLISFHLAILKKAGFLRDRKEGKWIYYSLNYGTIWELQKMTCQIFQMKRKAKITPIKRG